MVGTITIQKSAIRISRTATDSFFTLQIGMEATMTYNETAHLR